MSQEVISHKGSLSHNSTLENVGAFVGCRKLENYNGMHFPVNSFKCEHCNSTYATRGNLLSHLSIHSRNKPFSCEKCHKNFARHELLVNHLRLHANEAKLLELEKKFKHLGESVVNHSVKSSAIEGGVCRENLIENQEVQNHKRTTHAHSNSFACEKCHATFALESDLKGHLKIHSGEKTFQCMTCRKAFSGHDHLTRHLNIHASEKPLKPEAAAQQILLSEASVDESSNAEREMSCENLAENQKLKTSVRTHHTKPFECEKCHRTFAFKSILIRHLRSHSGEKPFKCQTCGRTFSRKEDLIKHSRKYTSEGGSLECGFSRNSSAFNKAPFDPLQIQENFDKFVLCHEMFSDVEMLNKHAAIHIKEIDFICKICDKTFTSQQNITEHLKLHFNKKPPECENKITYLQVRPYKKPFPFTCDICSKNFAARRSLTKHLKRHADARPSVCKVCHKQFSYRANLISHMKTIHGGEKRLDLKCQTCHKTFSDKWKLQTHERVHSQERPFQCEVCHKKFSRQGNLMTHIKLVHYSEKEHWECEVCHKTFTMKASKLMHLRIHTGERPFECDVCGNTFSRKQHLTNHLRIHTRERPYDCETCSRNFVLKTHLNAHKKTHLKTDIKIEPLS